LATFGIELTFRELGGEAANPPATVYGAARQLSASPSRDIAAGVLLRRTLVIASHFSVASGQVETIKRIQAACVACRRGRGV